MDITSALLHKADVAAKNEDYHLERYYINMVNQFQLIYDKLQDFAPDNQVANLVLACN